MTQSSEIAVRSASKSSHTVYAYINYVVLFGVLLLRRLNVFENDVVEFASVSLISVYIAVGLLLTRRWLEYLPLGMCAFMLVASREPPFSGIPYWIWAAFYIEYKLILLYLRARSTTENNKSRLMGAIYLSIPVGLHSVLDLELSLASAAIRAMTKVPYRSPPLPNYSYLRKSQWPNVVVILFIAILTDIPVTHILVAVFFHGKAATIAHCVAFVLHVYALICLIGDYRLLREGSVSIVQANTLVINMGTRGKLSVGLSDIADIVEIDLLDRETTPKHAIKITPIDRPNTLVSLRQLTPITAFGKIRLVSELRLYLDERACLINDVADIRRQVSGNQVGGSL